MTRALSAVDYVLGTPPYLTNNLLGKVPFSLALTFSFVRLIYTYSHPAIGPYSNHQKPLNSYMYTLYFYHEI